MAAFQRGNGKRNTDLCNLDRCLSILCWKLLVKLVKDAIDSLHTQTTAMDSQNHHHVCHKKSEHRWVKYKRPLTPDSLPCSLSVYAATWKRQRHCYHLAGAKRDLGPWHAKPTVGSWVPPGHHWASVPPYFSRPLLVLFFHMPKTPVDNTNTKQSTKIY